MFRKQAKSIGELLGPFLRQEGLETPLLERRLIGAWAAVTGATVARQTGERFIKNRTLYVKILNPALRQDLAMMRTQLVRRLNEQAGAAVITDIKVY